CWPHGTHERGCCPPSSRRGVRSPARSPSPPRSTRFHLSSTVSKMAPSSRSSCSPRKDHQYNLRSKRAKRAPKVVSVCQSSKRASRDQLVDGPPKKKKKKSVSMEDCINTVAKIFAASLRREQEEVDRALQMLEQDGVCKGSVRYLKAKSLFRDSNTRDVFTKMESAEVRLVWIDWSWKHRRGSS
ncbi:unnamed protein product, partial [Urochloa humidicola]